MNEQAMTLHRESIIIDGLNASYFLNPAVFPRLRQGGVTAVNGTVAAWHNYAETVAMIDQLNALLSKHSDEFLIVRSSEDIQSAKASNRTGFIIGFQDTQPIEDDLANLERFYKMGVRIIQLTYNTPNRVGCGCMSPEDTGLTDFGRDVVREMNRLGILVDLSHTSQKTTLDAIAVSEKPVAFTHANPGKFCPIARNKSDALLKAVAETGGVIGAVVFPPMLNCQPTAQLDDYLTVIDYMVELVGIDHVALGPDFMEFMPLEIMEAVLKDVPAEMQHKLMEGGATEGFSTVAEFPNVTAGLLERGYKEVEVQKIMGLNWLRLYSEVWQS